MVQTTTVRIPRENVENFKYREDTPSRTFSPAHSYRMKAKKIEEKVVPEPAPHTRSDPWKTFLFSLSEEDKKMADGWFLPD